MPYSAEISRANPGCILFVIDQSGSMGDSLGEVGSKQVFVADVLNRTLHDLILICSKEEGVRDYFDVGVIGYGGTGPANAMPTPLATQLLNPISMVEQHPRRVEDRIKKIPDGAGGLVDAPTKLPVWFDPVASGGTPMVAALSMAGECLADWADAHPSSYPPVLIHLTDGESTDGSPEGVAEVIKQVHTNDGGTVVMNVHASAGRGREILFPDSEANLPDDFARLLFRMSSEIPEGMRSQASALGIAVHEGSRTFAYNAGAEHIIHLFTIGTRPSNLR